VHAGGEVQQGFTTAKIYRNRNGRPDSLQTDDEIRLTTYFAFAQVAYVYRGWTATAGLSINRSQIEFNRFSNVPSISQLINFSNQLAPRIALLRKLTDKLSVYGVWSKGFSPPTSAELFPTGSISNPNLAAERGLNYEIGLKGYAVNNRLSFDINAFYFQLKNTIVQRRDAAAGDYYENAGSTRQRGIESQVNYRLIGETNAFKYIRAWISETFYDFHYRDFKQLNTDFSGKRLPSVPRHTVAAGLDIESKPGLYANITYQYTDPIPLNDANTDYATSYNLLSCRVGYKKLINSLRLDVFAGGDNLFDMRYSLGNDINAFGGRYYNAAAGRNYFVGISLGLNAKKGYGLNANGRY
jgi:iron complex outermembrane receptor protein